MEYELYHHGVKGMKWGVRKKVAKEVSEASRGLSGIANTASQTSKMSKAKRREVSAMSDQELRERINRLNMEQQYANLSPSRISVGASHAKSALEVIGSIATTAAAVAGIYAILAKEG